MQWAGLEGGDTTRVLRNAATPLLQVSVLFIAIVICLSFVDLFRVGWGSGVGALIYALTYMGFR